jgi:geranylgeranyl reductase family protein
VERESSTNEVHDVLIVGGGPGGSACAYWLASAGWDVVVVEKKRFPRDKTCGDGLTPRAVKQLADMGLEDSLTGAHRYRGLIAYGFGRTMELPWPAHPIFGDYGYTITRHDLDGIVADHAAKAGATVLQGSEALSPILEHDARPDPSSSRPKCATPSTIPYCAGARVRDSETGEIKELRARYVVVADGSNSRFGRALGTSRDRHRPMGMALRTYYTSPRHDESFIESHLDIRDASGNVVPGYGWIFPMGDGRVNVGVGLLSTSARWKGVNTTELMNTFVNWAPRSWELTPQNCCGPATGGKLPMGLSVTPWSGENTLVIGDAGGAINPFNGEGISYAYETGRLAANSLDLALGGGGREALATYARDLEETYSSYYAVGQAFVRMISNPSAMRVCVGAGMHSEFLMTQLLRVMANLMRPDVLGPAEIGFKGMKAASRTLDIYRGLKRPPAT